MCSVSLLLCSGGLAWWLATAQAETPALAILISSTPPFEHIRPDADLATVTFTAFLHGKPLSSGHLALQVTAPPRATVLTTDFPWVEGTPLLALNADLQQDGTFTLQYIFPIRGAYPVDLELTPVPGGPVFPSTRLSKTVHISENPAEVRYAWLLVISLFVLGVIVGMVFARSAAARDALPNRARMASWVLFGFLLCASSPVMAGTEHAAAASPGQSGHQVVQGADGWELEVRPQPPSATVGQLLELAIELRKDGVVVEDSTDVLVAVSSQENDQEILRTSLRLRSGQTTQRLQIFDGAPHTITVTAGPATAQEHGVAPLTVAFGIDVQALHPPMAVKLRVLGLLAGVLLLGMAVGFFFPRSDKELAGA